MSALLSPCAMMIVVVAGKGPGANKDAAAKKPLRKAAKISKERMPPIFAARLRFLPTGSGGGRGEGFSGGGVSNSVIAFRLKRLRAAKHDAIEPAGQEQGKIIWRTHHARLRFSISIIP